MEVESARPSPFACSLLFDYIASYMYEGDAPLAERRAQALTLDRALLAELLAADDLRELLDAEAIDRGGGRSCREAAARLPLTSSRSAAPHRRPARGRPGAARREAGRASVVPIEGRSRGSPASSVIAAEDAGLYRDGAGVVDRRRACRRPSWSRCRTRSAAGAAPCPQPRAVHRGGAARAAGGGCRRHLARAGRRGRLIEGGFRPGGSGREWIAPDVLRRVRRRTLARLRRDVEPVEPGSLGRFLPGWQGIGRDMGNGEPRLREVVSQLGGVALPVAAWEQDLLPLRIPGYRPALLDALCAAGELVWIGAGEGRVALYLRDDAPLLHPGARG